MPRMKKNKLTTESTYNDMPINTDKEKGYACNKNILDKYYAHLEDMTSKHSKVKQIRVDLSYPKDGSVVPNKEHISDFHSNFKRKLDRQNIKGGHKVDPRFITVEEQHNSEYPHYHTVLLVNANAKSKTYSIYQEAEKQWKQALKTDSNGLVDHCNERRRNGIVMDRNKDNYQELKDECFYQASYLAKERGKDKQAKGSWEVMATRLPKRK